jgi:hypothetical protein
MMAPGSSDKMPNAAFSLHFDVKHVLIDVERSLIYLVSPLVHQTPELRDRVHDPL